MSGARARASERERVSLSRFAARAPSRTLTHPSIPCRVYEYCVDVLRDGPPFDKIGETCNTYDSWCMDYMVTDPCSGNILQCGPRNTTTGRTCREDYVVLAQFGSRYHDSTTTSYSSLYWDGLTCVLWPRPPHINKTRASTLSDRRARVHRCECGSCCPCAVDDSMDYGVCVDDPDDDATASPVCVDMRQSGWTASAGTNLRNQRVTDLDLTDHDITCDLNVTGASPQSTARRPAAITREHVFRRRYGGDGADVETRDARFE